MSNAEKLILDKTTRNRISEYMSQVNKMSKEIYALPENEREETLKRIYNDMSFEKWKELVLKRLPFLVRTIYKIDVYCVELYNTYILVGYKFGKKDSLMRFTMEDFADIKFPF